MGFSMALRDLSVPDQREELVRLALRPGANKSELARRFGIDRSNLNKWLKRWREAGRDGLRDRSRRPQASPKRTGAALEAAVLRVRQASNGTWGGRKIEAVLKREGVAGVPRPSTITGILRRHGALEERAAAHPGPYRRFERAAPNQLWQIDFKGHFAIGRAGRRCHPLGVLDDHSRYAVVLSACGDEQDATVRERLTAGFRRYGLPDAMLMDNGAPWGDCGAQPWTAFGVWLLRLGVRVSHGRPRHPQTQGKEERFHRTLNVELLQGARFEDLADCQRKLDGWRHRYNHERPHQALGMAVPAARYRPSQRGFPERLPAIEYGAADQVRQVDVNGRISFKNRSWRLSKAFRGLAVALRATGEDGVWSLHFAAHRIGAVDLRAGAACGHVDNARALPTCPQAQQQQA
jgi:transposase InsO family protein